MRATRRTAIALALLAAGIPACESDWQRSDLNLARGATNGPLDREPTFGPTRVAEQPPPPISGGTLTVLRDGNTAVAADPDRDVVWVVDLASRSVRGVVSLRGGDEPGRVVEGPAGRAFVALRRGGAVAAIDLASPDAVAARYEACPAPRGLAYDAGADALYVACAGGELVSLRGSTGERLRSSLVADDLRDVVVLDGGNLLVTRFRAAEALVVSPSGAVIDRSGERVHQSQEPRFGEATDARTVAWRTVASPRGVFMVHQHSQTTTIRVVGHDQRVGVGVGAYGGGAGGRGPCGASGVVGAAVSHLVGPRSDRVWRALPSAALPVDVAVSREGRIVVVAAGNASIGGMPQLYTLRDDAVSAAAGCDPSEPLTEQPNAQVVAAAFDGRDELVAQTREPPALYLVDRRAVIRLPGASRADTGHAVFHANSGSGLACASCHPEGGDDGHVWNFSDVGARRTQNLRGGVLGGAPLHWAGELATLPDLVDETFVRRMAGPSLDGPQLAALTRWINAVPVPPRAAHAPPDAVARGRAVFHDPSVGCAACHGGERYTNNNLYDVGTGGRFKVPSLVGVALRAPYMHNGCATTLGARFGACGGGDAHGQTSRLSPESLADLVAFMESL